MTTYDYEFQSRAIRFVCVLIILIFVSSWLSCGTPDILDAIRTRIERKEKE